ncbi:hypothetical protein [Methyloglobulus sp.]|uniref:hypothetical protein n=1 Tax=Methyloglobulus sp. TaxID=2518622 RepID=UPI0017B25E62|nr:hypothetical protein [Methyloglobulus sp.]
MIGGIVGLLALIWVYQTATKANVTNGVMWVMICAAAYLASQFIMIGAANYIIESMRADQGEGYERDLMSVGDRKNLGGFQGSKGTLSSVFFELFPPIAGFMLVALIRTKFVLKESITKTNLFSGIGSMFISIKESFKNPDQK